VGRTSAVSQRSQRPLSQGRSCVRFAGFILPQEITLDERVLGRSSVYLHRTRRGQEEVQDLLYITQNFGVVPACRAY